MNVSIYEHQSGYNPNMPLRSLFYIVDIFRGFFGKRDVFSGKLISLPTPRFAVFYNGRQNRPEKEILKLSAAYAHPTEEPQLELICTVYNINPGLNNGLQCRVLEEYTIFIETVRKYESEKDEHPVERAIRDCIRDHILEKFLRERGAEVINVMTIDMTFEAREKLFRAEEHEDGRKEGQKEGRKEGISDVLKDLLAEGIINEEKAEEIRQKCAAGANNA